MPIDVAVCDSTDEPLFGSYTNCYINGFQTQPGDPNFWRTHPDLLVTDEAGRPVVGSN